jgi:hypothetical protein
MPNANEEYRKEIEARNEALDRYEESRNALASELREIKGLLNNHLCKSDKQRVLNKIRELETTLGIEGEPYNG